MKKITLFIIFIAVSCTKGKSQNLELGFGIGSGKAFIVEDSNNSGANIIYSTPFSSYIDLKISKADKYFGAKVRFQYLNSGITGTDWKSDRYDFDGDIVIFTTMILLEHLKSDNNWNFGYNFGLGYTNQILRPNLNYSSDQIISNYMSFNGGGIISRKINKNILLRIEPSVLWTDPINLLRGINKSQIAGEDISLLMQLGVVYRLN